MAEMRKEKSNEAQNESVEVQEEEAPQIVEQQGPDFDDVSDIEADGPKEM